MLYNIIYLWANTSEAWIFQIFEQHSSMSKAQDLSRRWQILASIIIFLVTPAHTVHTARKLFKNMLASRVQFKKKRSFKRHLKYSTATKYKKYYARAIFVEFKVKFCTHFETNLDSVTSYWMRYNLAWQCIFSRSLIRFHRGFFTVSFRSMFYKYLLI